MSQLGATTSLRLYFSVRPGNSPPHTFPCRPLPVLTSNLTTVAAFLPLAGLPGGKDDFNRDLRLTTSLSEVVHNSPTWAAADRAFTTTSIRRRL